MFDVMWCDVRCYGMCEVMCDGWYYLICEIWCVMCDVMRDVWSWCVIMMCDVWCVMCDVWCVMCDVVWVMCDVWCVIMMCDVWCVGWSVKAISHLKCKSRTQQQHQYCGASRECVWELIVQSDGLCNMEGIIRLLWVCVCHSGLLNCYIKCPMGRCYIQFGFHSTDYLTSFSLSSDYSGL